MLYLSVFFFNGAATTEIYTLSLHDALPILDRTGEIPQKNIEELFALGAFGVKIPKQYEGLGLSQVNYGRAARSEEHTSELQSRRDLVCRLLLEKKKNDKRKQDPNSLTLFHQ